MQRPMLYAVTGMLAQRGLMARQTVPLIMLHKRCRCGRFHYGWSVSNISEALAGNVASGLEKLGDLILQGSFKNPDERGHC